SNPSKKNPHSIFIQENNVLFSTKKSVCFLLVRSILKRSNLSQKKSTFNFIKKIKFFFL
uniref:Uncharacterized protein n=1 Tax=Oryza brachyantha TaxID=4533 RepID=J3LG59_ORYBR